MYTYTVNGLTFASEVALPALLPGSSPPEVSIRLGKVNQQSPASFYVPGIRWWASQDEIQLIYRDQAAISISGGREICIDPEPGSDESLLRLILLGPVLACLLHQRGLLVLHASSIVMKNSAVAFLGEKGSGKSTTAAALNARGHSLVADDILALDMSSARPESLPGIPQIKLLPEAAAALGADPDSLPRLHPYMEKRARQPIVSPGFQRLPLSRLYILAENPVASITPLRPQNAFVELIRHSYVARFNGLLERTGTHVRHFAHCAALLESVRAFRLSRQSQSLPVNRLADLVEDHLGQES